MNSSPPSRPPATDAAWRAALRSLSLGRLAVTIGAAFVAALALNHIFVPPFVVVFGRAVAVALLLLVAFTAAGHWRQRLVPRWLAQVIAVVAMAPVATAMVYLLSTGGDVQAIVEHPARVAGFVSIAGSALLIGVVLALGAQVRERDARTRALELELELQRSRQERQALDARLELLTAQIEPHFLFNTLANVQALVETGSPRAAAVLRSLIAYLRATLPRLHGQGASAVLQDELALVGAYLELMHLRMPDRLSYRVDVPAALSARAFPAMALLTLVENAVRHGIDPSEEGGQIEIGALAQPDGGMRLWVTDTGVGLPLKFAPGTGLSNLRERLQGLYGEAASVSLASEDPRGTRAEIVVPAAVTVA